AALIGVGGAFMIVGFAMLAPRQSAINKLNMDCRTDMHCPMGDSSTGDQGKLFTGLTEIFVPVGVVGVVTGAVLLARSGPSKPEKDKKDGDEKKDGDGEKKDAFWRNLQVVPGARGANVGGLSLVGRF